MASKTSKTVRIGFLSRIDYGSDGFRQGLLELAAEIFKADDVAFVVLAGGLVSGRSVVTKTKKLARELRIVKRTLKSLEKAIEECEDRVADLKAAKNAKKALAAAQEELEKLHGENLAALKQETLLEAELEALTPEWMAEELAERLPRFTNAAGKKVKLYVVPSTPYDKDVGILTADLIAKKRGNEEFRVLTTDGDRLPLWEGESRMKILEVLTLDKQPWLRGDYDSTSPQRRIKDRKRQSSNPKRADIQAVGGTGVSIMKPEGQYPTGFMALPVLHRIEGTTTAERQVGVHVMEVHSDRRNVVMRSHSFRDLISRERSFIGVPGDLTPVRQKCIDLLKAEGTKMTTGRLADATGISREEIVKELAGILASPDHKRRKTWPGLDYDEAADRWDFDLEWVKMNLRYPQPTGERKVDKAVCICCIHAGSADSDYKHLITEAPKVMLETGATMLISAGDHVEGTKHKQLEAGEIIGGWDNTTQEELAAYIIAHILFTVFKARYDAALKEAKPLSDKEVRALVGATLPLFRYIPGNHCGWIATSAVRPLVTMIHEIVQTLIKWIGAHLASNDQRVDDLLGLVKSHIVTVDNGGRFTLPSGLPAGMAHPHMGGSKTISSSAQQALDMFRDCVAVFIGNFHTGCIVEEWDPQLGQRGCYQIGTAKHQSGFESSKLKPGLDQGFLATEIVSVNGRVLLTVTTYHSNDKAKPEDKRFDTRKFFNDFVAWLGITP